MKWLPPQDWDCHHMTEAYLAARKSKDRRTQVGAVIVGPGHDDRTKGYNGPLRGLNDLDPDIYLKPTTGGPSPFMGHAERNALAMAARVGISIKGCTMYCTLVSCQHCAADVANSGISEIKFHAEMAQSLNDTQQIGLEIYRKCGVMIHFWSGIPLIEEILVDGKVINLPSLYRPPARRHDYGVHETHCGIGLYEGSCKYGDDDCPMMEGDN